MADQWLLTESVVGWSIFTFILLVSFVTVDESFLEAKYFVVCCFLNIACEHIANLTSFLSYLATKRVGQCLLWMGLANISCDTVTSSFISVFLSSSSPRYYYYYNGFI